METSGLSYLGMGVGFLVGMLFFAALSDRIIKAKTKDAALLGRHDAATNQDKLVEAVIPEAIKEGPPFKPELRLFLMVCLTPILPFGFFWYGWAAQEKAHWIVPILGTSLIGVSIPRGFFDEY